MSEKSQWKAGEVQHEITVLLQAWRNGDEAALDRLIPLAYPELHRLAHRYMKNERKDHTLQASALVNEAYLRLTEANRVDWHDREHFFAVASTVMRQLLIQHARSRQAHKRPDCAARLNLDENLIPSPEHHADIVIAVDQALCRLAVLAPREARLVELRFFGGLGEQEIAHLLSVSERTVRREWEHAKAWLVRELGRGSG